MMLMVLDGNSLINRAFYGIRTLTASDGTHTNAVYGFINILTKLLADHSPEALCVTFDLPAPTFRHAQFAAYKAQRKPMPEELAEQLPLLKQVLDAMRIPRFELAGYEADDLIGTISRRCQAEGDTCLIVTGDKDSFQLITDATHVLHIKSRMGQTESTEYDVARFEQEYGFEPAKIVDLKALMGDSSDNIPGVRGIGEKGALELIRRFGSLDGVYQQLDSPDLKPAMRAKLEAGRDSAYASYALATIETNAPLAFSPEACLRAEPDRAALLALFQRLDFYKLIDRFGLRETQAEAAPAPAQSTYTPVADAAALDALLQTLSTPGGQPVALLADPTLSAVALSRNGTTYMLQADVLGTAFDAALRRLLTDDIPKLTHDLKALDTRLLAQGFPCKGFVFDTILAAYILSPTDGQYTLERLAQARLGLELPPASAYTAPDAFAPLAQPDAALQALSAHAAATWSLYGKLLPELQARGMEALLTDMELPLSGVLAEMERAGFLVDRAALLRFGELLNAQIDTLETEIYRQAGETFNINSPKQLGAILFDKLMLPGYKKTKSGYSTNIDVLERLLGKHPIVASVIEYRKLTKLRSTYVDGLLKAIADDGRVHTNFTMTVTATGRLSSTDPNLQNIPVRTELGRELRRMFIAPAGSLLVDADYSQIELRLLAHISGDEALRGAFLHGEDIHRQTAAYVFGVAPEAVTAFMRSSAKAVNFGIVYGISDFSLAGDIGVTRQEARRYMDSYFEKYHGVREYMHNIVEQAKRDGYVTHAVWPAARHSGAACIQPQYARIRRARCAQHTGAGFRRRHHQAGDGQRRPAVAAGRPPFQADHAGARRADRRSAGGRGRVRGATVDGGNGGRLRPVGPARGRGQNRPDLVRHQINRACTLQVQA